jgi:hypothetical protein
VKLCKWCFPLVVTVMAAGLWRLVRRVPLHGVSVAVVAAACACLFLPLHTTKARLVAGGMTEIAESRQPVKAWRRLCQRIDELGVKKLYLVHQPAGVFPRCLIAYLVHPRPMVNGWKDSWLEPSARDDVVSEVGADVLPLMWGQPPFEAPQQKLPGGLSVLDREHPVLFQIENVGSLECKAGEKRRMCFGAKTVKFHVWSAKARQALLTWKMSPGPGKHGTGKRQLQLRQPDGTITELATVEDHTAFSVRLSVPAGVSLFELSCTDADIVTRTAAEDTAADRLTTLSDVKFTLTGQRETAAKPLTTTAR